MSTVRRDETCASSRRTGRRGLILTNAFPTIGSRSLDRESAELEDGSTGTRKPMAHRLTTCTFCGVGCGLYLETGGQPGGGRLSQHVAPHEPGPDLRARLARPRGGQFAGPPEAVRCSRRTASSRKSRGTRPSASSPRRLQGDPRPARSRCARLSEFAALLERGSLPAAEAGPRRHRHEQRGSRRRRLLQQLDQRPARHDRRAGHHQLHRRTGPQRGHPRGRRGSGRAAADHRRSRHPGQAQRGQAGGHRHPPASRGRERRLLPADQARHRDRCSTARWPRSSWTAG